MALETSLYKKAWKHSDEKNSSHSSCQRDNLLSFWILGETWHKLGYWLRDAFFFFRLLDIYWWWKQRNQCFHLSSFLCWVFPYIFSTWSECLMTRFHFSSGFSLFFSSCFWHICGLEKMDLFLLSSSMSSFDKFITFPSSRNVLIDSPIEHEFQCQTRITTRTPTTRVNSMNWTHLVVTHWPI